MERVLREPPGSDRNRDSTPLPGGSGNDAPAARIGRVGGIDAAAPRRAGTAGNRGRIASHRRGPSQPSRGLHHRRRHHHPGHRHQGIGERQQRHRDREGERGAPVHRDRRFVRQPRELEAVHSREHGDLRAVRMVGHPSRSGRDLLRLHRLRRRVDRRAGSEESTAGHAHRDSRFARRVHRPLHHRGSRDERDRALLRAQRPGSDRGRGRSHRDRVAASRREARRDFRFVFGDPGDAPRPAPDLLHHGEGRLASPVRGEDPSAFPDSSHHHHRHRRLRGALGGAPPDPDSRRAGLHRNPSRVRHRVRRCLGASKDASRDSAAVQNTSRTLGSPGGHAGVLLSHDRSSPRHVVSAFHLARPRASRSISSTERATAGFVPRRNRPSAGAVERGRTRFEFRCSAPPSSP